MLSLAARGVDTLSGGAGNDTFNLANGNFASGESIDGGDDTDAIVLTNATTVNFTTGTVSNVERLTGSTGNDTVTMSAPQWAGFNTIDLGSGSNVLNVVASGGHFGRSNATVSNVTTGNLTGTSGNETLTGAQLDAIIIGAGTINLGAGTDTINLTSTYGGPQHAGRDERFDPRGGGDLCGHGGVRGHHLALGSDRGLHHYG